VKGYTGPIVKPSKVLATEVRNELDGVGMTRSTYAGKLGIDTRTDLGGLNLSKVPKVLVELGNMRNGNDANDMKSPKWREIVANALRRSLEQFVNGA
jgi:N-acetylmuramoyl-L-alanine amidase